FFGNILIGWLWLDMASHAKKALHEKDTQYSEDFYLGKIHAMKFYYKYELPKTTSLSEILLNKEVLTVDADTKIFD
ncbi:MAG: acyl-CoA dehydrogenase C-terminal domain-containing protein, partial [Eudoraea sp.]